MVFPQRNRKERERETETESGKTATQEPRTPSHPSTETIYQCWTYSPGGCLASNPLETYERHQSQTILGAFQELVEPMPTPHSMLHSHP